MGGGAQQTENQSSALAQQQANIAEQYLTMSQGQLARGQALQQPLIDFYTGITSGNPNAIMTASAPMIGNISQQSQAAQAQIWNNTPAGAGRDVALAQVPLQQSSQVAGTLNQTYNNALTGLAQLGTGAQSVGISEAGVGNQGIQGAQSAYGNIMQTQEQQKASTMGMIGSIVGGATGALTGGLFGGGGGGGGSVMSAVPGYMTGVPSAPYSFGEG